MSPSQDDLPYSPTSPFSDANLDPAMPHNNAVRISLTSDDGGDERTLVISSTEPGIIGRSSKSDFKNMVAAPDNALFDCPIVSRLHAEIQFSPSKPSSEQITLTDRFSLHGTTVNGLKLAPGRAFVLQSGDSIKLGDRIARGKDVHEGVSITFRRLNSIVAAPSSVRAFQVPSDDEASDYESDNESVTSPLLAPSCPLTTLPQEEQILQNGSSQHPIILGAMSKSSDVIDLEDEGPVFLTSQGHSWDSPITRNIDTEGRHRDGETSHAAKNHFDTIPSSDPDEESLSVLDDPIDESDPASDSDQSDVSVSDSGAQEAVDTPAQQTPPTSYNMVPSPAPYFAATTLDESNFDSIRPRYDPVREVPPPKQYDSPPLQLAALDSGTDKLCRSRWDVPSTFQAPLVPVDHFSFNQFPLDEPLPGCNFMEKPVSLPTAYQYFVDKSAMELNGPSGGEVPLYPLTPTGDVPAPQKKISIPDLVDSPARATEDEFAQPRQAAKDDLTAKLMGNASSKRKATEIDDPEVDISESANKKVKQTNTETSQAYATSTPTLITRSKNARKIKRRGSTWSRLQNRAAHVVAGTLMGIGATLVFLNSDSAQQLIDWLA